MKTRQEFIRRVAGGLTAGVAARAIVLINAALLFLPSAALAAQFTGGPSVRVTPNVSVEFKWITDVVWAGRVEVFNNPDGTGVPLVSVSTIDPLSRPIVSAEQVVTIMVPPLPADTALFFRVTAIDPMGGSPDLITPTPLPPFFTGTQAIGDVFANPDINSAVIWWEANVIGYGAVLYDTTPPLTQGPIQGTYNTTNHAIQLTGLSAATIYQFQVCNKHAIDLDCMATSTGQFTTAAPPVNVVLTQAEAQPRVVKPNDVAMLSVKPLHQGQPIAGVIVWFDIDTSSSGGGTFQGSPSASATTDANGVASVQITGTASGLVHVNVTSASALNPLSMPVIVR